MRDEEESLGPYLHLTAADVWNSQQASGSYRPEAFEADGFVHCTIGEDNLIAVANAFYAGDRRAHVVLEIAPSRLSSPVRFEDPARIYPHIHGPLNGDAVISVRRVWRAPDGTFLETEPAPAPTRTEG